VNAEQPAQFSLRALLGVMLLFAVSAGLLKWSFETHSILCGAIAARSLAIAVVGAIMALIVGNLNRAMLAALVSVVWSDFAWFAVLLCLGWEPKPRDSWFLAFNPLAMFALIASPAATATRPRQLRWGLVLASAAPLVVAVLFAVYILSNPGNRGLAGPVIFLGTPLAVANSAFTTLLGFIALAFFDCKRLTYRNDRTLRTQ